MIDIPRLLALDVGGNPHKWITYEDAAYYYAKGLIAWQMGDDDFRLRGGVSSATGTQSKLDINSIVAIKGALISRIAGFETPPLNNKSLFRRDKNICAYCEQVFTDSFLTRDHVFPVSRGGPNTWENVVASCGPCNKHKDNKTPTEANMPLSYQPYSPNRCEYLILQNKNILPDQLEFLMKRVSRESRLRITEEA